MQMNNTTEDATGRQNKRRRTDDETPTDGEQPPSAAAAASAAAASPVVADTALYGKQFDLVEDDLASQPAELRGTIIPQMRGMLETNDTINQRTTSHGRFDKPMKDPSTGAILLDDNDQPKPFIPNNLRKQPPIVASKATKDEPRMKALTDRARQKWEAYQAEAAKDAKEASALEITIRVEKLRNQWFEFVNTLALGHVIVKKTRDGGFASDMKLDADELADKVAYQIISKLEKKHTTVFRHADGPNLAAEYEKQRKFDNAALEEKWNDGADKNFVNSVEGKIQDWTTSMTFMLWANEKAKDRDRQVEAALREVLKPRAMRKANEDVEAALEEEDGTANSDAVRSLARKEVKAEVGRQVQVIQRQLRKKYSGDTAEQASKPTKPGRKSGKTSVDSKQKQQQQQKQKKATGGGKQPPKSTPRTGGKSAKKDDGGDAQRRTPRKKSASTNGNRGKAGGANKGGNGKRAGRR
jgi:hypothetical protein